MTEITLSICIPTYNRAAFLDYLLSQALDTWMFDFEFEIVISDNASTDHTQDIVQLYCGRGLPIKYYRQPFNKGSTANLLTAFHRASGHYVLYLADDDLLIPSGLLMSIDYLKANPDIRALYAPWELYDDIAKQVSGTFYPLEHDTIFNPGQEIDLFSLLIKNHIFPEIMIYRADALRVIITDHQFCYWAFSYLAHVIAQGPIVFLKTPFYRSVTATPVAPNRGQAGHEQAMTEWDSYRGGLEYFVYVMLLRSAMTPTLVQKRAFRDMIDAFVNERMRVALRIWLARGDYLRAYEIVCRLHFLTPDATANVGNIAMLPLLAFGQTIARLANCLAGLKSILRVDPNEFDAFCMLLQNVGLDPAIAIISELRSIDVATRNSTLVIIKNNAERQGFLDLGFAPGLVLSEVDVTGGIHLSTAV